MNSFFMLVSFEYKKLFKRRSIVFSLILSFVIVLFLCITSVTANFYWHSEGGTPLWDAMTLDKKVVRSNAGIIDETFINEALAQNALMISNDENYIINDYGKHLKNEAYIKYVLPYEKAVRIINTVYEPDINNLSTDGYQIFNLNGIKPIDTLTYLREDDFYTKIKQTISEFIDRRPSLSGAEKEKHMQMLSQVKTPFYSDYNEAFSRFTQISQVIALTLLIVVAICLSPIFAGEYQLRTDQIILSSRFGKNKVIFAKLFTGASFTSILSTIMLFAVCVSLTAIYGFSGYDTAIQTIDFFSSYPITALQAVLIAAAVTFFVTVSFAMFTMLLSALLKSPFSAVIVSFLILFVPPLILISPKNRLIYQILQIFPVKATDFFNIFSYYFFNIPGFTLTPAVFYIIFATVISIAIIPFAYRSFKNHQIG